MHPPGYSETVLPRFRQPSDSAYRPLMSTEVKSRGGILSPAYLATTIATCSMIAVAAFEALAVTTVMPTLAE